MSDDTKKPAAPDPRTSRGMLEIMRQRHTRVVFVPDAEHEADVLLAAHASQLFAGTHLRLISA